MNTYLRNMIIGMLLIVGFQSEVFALTNERMFSQFRFNFITPGARATAMGGAFIGLADDATAAATNPAGLTNLTAPEFSLEFKHIGNTSKQFYSNSSFWGYFNSNIVYKKFDDIVESVPFVGMVYPYKRMAFSLYRQESAHYQSSCRTGALPITVPETFTLFFPEEASADLAVTDYGIGIALQLFDWLTLAISPRRSEMDLTASSAGFLSGDDFPYDFFSEPTDFSETDFFEGTRISDKDSGYSIHVGTLWTPHSKFSLGLVYRSGPKFTVKERLILTEKFIHFQGYGYEQYSLETLNFTLKIPDSFGAGISFRATDFFTLTCDVVYIEYEDLLEDFDIIQNPDRFSKEHYTIDNVTELHAGLEFMLTLGRRYLGLRAGIYYEPDHSIRFTGTTGNAESDVAGKTIFPGGDDQIHVTGGLGLVLNEHFQFDSAVDIADRYKQLSLSAVFRF